MRVLFRKKYNMIVECTRMEDILSSYKVLMMKLGAVVRNKVWKKSDEESLAYVLFCCNNIFSILIDAIGEHVQFADLYLRILVKYWNLYANDKCDGEFDVIYTMIHSVIADEITKDQWERINPYYKFDYSDDDLYGKKFTEVLGDFMSNVDVSASKEFFIEEEKLGRLVRARRGNHSLGEDIYPPSIETAIDQNIINRWNPPGKRYLYLAFETEGVSPDEVCLEEIRSKVGESITLVDFKVKENARKKRLLNLAYEGVNDIEIEADISEMLDDIVQADVEQVKTDAVLGKYNIDITINNVMKANEEKIKTLANIYIGRKLLSTICRVIFIPLDKDEDCDSDLKDKCYKSFHILAQYLEENNIDGVVYPSTRMMLKGKAGINVVLFDPEDAEPIQSTLRHVTT